MILMENLIHKSSIYIYNLDLKFSSNYLKNLEPRRINGLIFSQWRSRLQNGARRLKCAAQRSHHPAGPSLIQFHNWFLLVFDSLLFSASISILLLSSLSHQKLHPQLEFISLIVPPWPSMRFPARASSKPCRFTFSFLYVGIASS